MVFRNINFKDDLRVVFILGMAQKLLLRDILNERPGMATIIFHAIPMENDGESVFIDISPRSIYGWIRSFALVRYLIYRMRKGTGFYLYTPHVLNFISNYFANELIPKRISYLYDGTLNFVSPRWDSELFSGYIKRQQAKSFCFLISYRTFEAWDIIAQEEIADELIIPSGLPITRLRFCGQIRSLELSQGLNSKGNDVVERTINRMLFLAPPKLNSTIYKEILSISKDLAERFKIDEIIIKTHPSKQGSSIDADFFANLGVDLCYAPTLISAEEIYIKYSPSCVFSTNSSALLNIKCFNLGAYVFAAEECFSSEELMEIKEVFLECGIEML